MATTRIEWTRGDDGTAGVVWNPTTGCDRVSPGCDHCYAMTMAKRLKGMGSPKYQTDGDPRTSGPGFGLAVHSDALALPFKWRKPKRVFVNSMSDLFHARVPREFVKRVWDVMALTPQHTYQILTKRPDRMERIVSGFAGSPLPNVWLGTSIEDQDRAEQRLSHLHATPAAIRWVSCEPLLGPVDLGIGDPHRDHESDDVHGYPHPRICLTCSPPDDEENEVKYFRREPGSSGLDWVVVGGESGPGARSMQPGWALSLRDQCAQAGVPFFFKQWGESVAPNHMPEATFMSWDVDNGTSAYDRDLPWRVGKKRAGRLLDGVLHDAYPAAAVPDAG